MTAFGFNFVFFESNASATFDSGIPSLITTTMASQNTQSSQSPSHRSSSSIPVSEDDDDIDVEYELTTEPSDDTGPDSDDLEFMGKHHDLVLLWITRTTLTRHDPALQTPRQEMELVSL